MAKHRATSTREVDLINLTRSILAVLLWTYRLGWAIYVTSHLT